MKTRAKIQFHRIQFHKAGRILLSVESVPGEISADLFRYIIIIGYFSLTQSFDRSINDGAICE